VTPPPREDRGARTKTLHPSRGEFSSVHTRHFVPPSPARDRNTIHLRPFWAPPPKEDKNSPERKQNTGD